MFPRHRSQRGNATVQEQSDPAGCARAGRAGLCAWTRGGAETQHVFTGKARALRQMDRWRGGPGDGEWNWHGMGFLLLYGGMGGR